MKNFFIKSRESRVESRVRRCLGLATRFSTLVTILLLAACNSFDSDLPYKPGFMPTLPKGSPEFTQGWKDGCATGLAAYGNDVYKTIYKWTRSPQFEGNDKYLKAWKDAYGYCRQYANTWDAKNGPGIVPMDSDPPPDPFFEATRNNTNNFLSLPTADGFFSSPSTDNLFGGDAVGNFFGN